MELVTVFNRTSKSVEGVWDGRRYQVGPHEKVALPVIVAEAMKRQNAVMGSEDAYSGEMEYLVAIVEQGDPDFPIEQTKAITRMNRSHLKDQEMVVKGRSGLYASEVNASLPIENSFVKP